jgi:heme/copper-type cytochrome/quinol oxidase subunit 3
MTGLHGIHVIIGMALIFWVTLRSTMPRHRPALLALAPLLIGAYVVFVGGITHSTTTMIAGGVVVLLAVVLAGIGLAVGRKRPALAAGDFSSEYFTPVDLVGLYWHLVDLIWIFLFPLLYLIH